MNTLECSISLENLMEDLENMNSFITTQEYPVITNEGFVETIKKFIEFLKEQVEKIIVMIRANYEKFNLYIRHNIGKIKNITSKFRVIQNYNVIQLSERTINKYISLYPLDSKCEWIHKEFKQFPYLSIKDQISNLRSLISSVTSNNLNDKSKYLVYEDGEKSIYYSIGINGELEEKLTTSSSLENVDKKSINNLKFSKLFITQLANKLDEVVNDIPNIIKTVDLVKTDVNNLYKSLSSTGLYKKDEVLAKNLQKILTKIIPKLYSNLLINIKKYNTLFNTILKDINSDPIILANEYLDYCKKTNTTGEYQFDANKSKVVTKYGLTYIEVNIDSPELKNQGGAWTINVRPVEKYDDIKDDSKYEEISYSYQPGANHQFDISRGIDSVTTKKSGIGLIFTNEQFILQNTSLTKHKISFQYVLYHELGHIVTSQNELSYTYNRLGNLDFTSRIALKYFESTRETRSDAYAAVMTNTKFSDVFEWRYDGFQWYKLFPDKTKEEIKKTYIDNLNRQLGYVKQVVKIPLFNLLRGKLTGVNK